jgi:hypothetical protein
MSGRGEGQGFEASEPAPRREVLDPAALFRSLADAEIEYVLVGGLAVAAHGAPRATGDLDICPNPVEVNLRRLAGFLESVEAVSVEEGELDPDELPACDLEGLRGGGNFRLRTTLGALDVMQWLKPFEDDTWQALNKRAERRQVFDQTIRLCSYEDLIKMKQAAGRDQDLIDINNIKAARREL